MEKINLPIVGLPNVGKSTLLNMLIGEKMSIVTHKPHTTRSINVFCKKDSDLELVFADTPGLGKANSKLSAVIFKNMHDYLKSLDLMILVLDATNPRIDKFLPYIDKSIVVINKIDHVRKHKILPIIQNLKELNVLEVFCVCGKTGDGVNDLLQFLKNSENLKVDSSFENHIEKEFDIANYASEVVREKILLEFDQEIPYKIFLKVKSYRIPKNSAWEIFLDIIVPKESYKPILIGKNCEKLKSIGKSARLEISFKLKQPGFLGLNVVFDKDLWKHPETYNSLGWFV